MANVGGRLCTGAACWTVVLVAAYGPAFRSLAVDEVPRYSYAVVDRAAATVTREVTHYLIV